ncbi:hypothetical protein [Tateyamaria pelophila]|uniref:hypothetical protein n=1 Tax=Tateyamaria pelophila TaxID=328415 RepID=UPI001CBD3B1B|nr:hypothetical protein [Tateyamaria pelophila]
MKRVILHAGFHKTGTSHVQRTLRANARALSPYVTLRVRRDMKALMRATRSFSSMSDMGALTAVATEFRSLLNEIEDAACLVIAAEELSGHLPGRPRVSDYSAAPILAEIYSSAIRDRWPRADVIFHYGTRARQDWLPSAYWEHVKSSSITMNLEDFVARYHTATDLDGIAAQVADLGLEVQTTPLESARGRFGPAEPVLKLCNLPNDLILKPQRPHNERLASAVLLDLLAANRAYPDRAALKAAKAAILAKAET